MTGPTEEAAGRRLNESATRPDQDQDLLAVSRHEAPIVDPRPSAGAHPSQRARVRAVPEQPTQQPPPVQKIRIRYAKRGRLRFTSHRDFGRAFERAVSRAGLPIAYSSGLQPPPADLVRQRRADRGELARLSTSRSA